MCYCLHRRNIDTLVYDMSKASKTIRVSESLHEQITAHNREDETLNER